jgi:hypothetical protein
MFTKNQNSNNGLPSPDYLYNLPLFLLNDDGYPPNTGDPLLRKWLLILTGRIWEDYPYAFQRAFRGDYVEPIIMDFLREDKDPLGLSFASSQVLHHFFSPSCSGLRDWNLHWLPRR